jgi:PadR family transcriptional regulator, regulatory protein PadR
MDNRRAIFHVGHALSDLRELFCLDLSCTLNIFTRPCYSSIFFLICLTKYKDMGKEFLGEFEELILTMVAALQEDAYGAAISNEIETKFNREVNLSAVHVTLYRLEDKGYIKSRMGGGTKERGGRRKRIFTVTSAGLAMLRVMKETRLELWKMVPQLGLGLKD